MPKQRGDDDLASATRSKVGKDENRVFNAAMRASTCSDVLGRTETPPTDRTKTGKEDTGIPLTLFWTSSSDKSLLATVCSLAGKCADSAFFSCEVVAVKENVDVGTLKPFGGAAGSGTAGVETCGAGIGDEGVSA